MTSFEKFGVFFYWVGIGLAVYSMGWLAALAVAFIVLGSAGWNYER